MEVAILKQNRKIIVIVVLAILTLFLAACSDNKTDESSQEELNEQVDIYIKKFLRLI